VLAILAFVPLFLLRTLRTSRGAAAFVQ